MRAAFWMTLHAVELSARGREFCAVGSPKHTLRLNLSSGTWQFSTIKKRSVSWTEDGREHNQRNADCVLHRVVTAARQWFQRRQHSAGLVQSRLGLAPILDVFSCLLWNSRLYSIFHSYDEQKESSSFDLHLHGIFISFRQYFVIYCWVCMASFGW